MADSLAALEQLFQALGDRTRLRILGLLAGGEVCVCHLHESLQEPQPKVSRHLAYLRRAGLVETRREGLWVHYRLAPLGDPVLQTIQGAVSHALGHVETLSRDARRLSKRQACEPRGAASAPGCACCAASASGPLHA